MSFKMNKNICLQDSIPNPYPISFLENIESNIIIVFT